MIDPPPIIRLLEAIKLTADGVDYLTDAGVAGVTVRHRRNRHSHAGEIPCVAIELIEDVTPDEGALSISSWEKPRHLWVRFIADVDLPPEIIDPDDSDPGGPITEGPDPTGNLAAARLLAATLRALKDPASPIMGLCDYISGRDIVPAEESKEDKGRLELTTLVIYRVREDDENVLLAAGENA